MGSSRLTIRSVSPGSGYNSLHGNDRTVIRQQRVLRQIGAHLAQADVSCALVGGLAVSVRTEPRFTRDADLAVAVKGDAEAEALITNLRAFGYHVDTIVEQSAVGPGISSL